MGWKANHPESYSNWLLTTGGVYRGVMHLKGTYVFPAIFTYAEDGISIEFPDLPGCLTCGSDEEEAVNNARDALQLHLYGMEEDNEVIPKPAKICDLDLRENQVPVLIDALMPPYRDKMAARSVNRMVTLPRWLDQLASKKNVNFSQVLQTALKNDIGVFDYTQLKKNP